ncbi:MAG: phosphoribosylaminoimidazolesuccinocarboxamide synthase [Actinobacteria bacterium]|uniref:phosphoribosylaminoimidazolesuccinocarboxamide synthase n=1 Tax=freshwater metagenome TaxID=449393 RepID=A0A6J7CD29_9ZZZZ|nr:phosphoribosylaminoimidazolesuccinocarboxamide synthase [Actinomycetota bacterium]MSY04334.1 phosphoribosylaminoimidazolesuccinocarboxamide synthase [Actinomycetota bacterium]MSY66820.1 phosphoribosylaminoimidazolesuccinocarboxamide synthase [Actinomycetota bacterium]MSZ59146.1 phosphoribosylaminoimidazolesuccinocarboxamide synthase [Actinomycetota bacterium]MTA00880.1 phosphoribosylaminoimidazolesuccinocarboxamide synthase [Actinomycetota bacterium]
MQDLIQGWTHFQSGKVRDLYRDANGEILLVASDRISAYDWIMPTDIPDKGAILTKLSLFWFEKLNEITAHHVISGEVPVAVKGRAIICKPLTIFPVECVVRGYLAGSGWVEYQKNSEVCGVPLPGGLLDGSKLVEPIFTPATKAAMGDHDENISLDQAKKIIGKEIGEELSARSIKIYNFANEFARERGIIIADTKFEFGRDEHGVIHLADEVLTPDSSRFWPLSSWKPGGKQLSYDKQFLRDWLTASGWDRSSPPPELPDEIVEKTRERYLEAYFTITGEKFEH